MLMICYSTKLDEIKLRPFLDEYKGEIALVLTLDSPIDDLLSLTPDFKMDDEELEMLKDTANLSSGNKQIKVITGVLTGMRTAIGMFNPTAVMVVGNTSSAMACALATRQYELPVTHLDAGLRNGKHSESFTEETNGCVIAELSSLNLCATMEAVNNLGDENVPGTPCLVGPAPIDGNVAYDISGKKVAEELEGFMNYLKSIKEEEASSKDS